MRQGLSDALRFSPVPTQDVAYPAGSIVVCYACGKPIYRLQANIYVGEKPSASAWKYAPIRPEEYLALCQRTDLDPGLTTNLRTKETHGADGTVFALMTEADVVEHCAAIPTFKAGDFMDCASCKQPFVFGRTSTNGDGAREFLDRAFVIQLATIQPAGKARRLTRVSA